ncbi:APOBEC1 complementation factor [Araneus ventricosus]|uniref:APOBEC1 complementation factor n=1 Tax=Araneus ventricosus TaxID=182803 RepID=A0A4Y2U5V7_ARAVE|nr:APOBEC1 complementation factor [Araneus ventricosus]
MTVPTEASRMLPKNECKFVQVNGQLRYGPPKDWSGPPPSKGCEIFIGKLPPEICEDELLQLFELIGPIYELRLMIQFSNANRGFAFATYTNKEDAKKAILKLDGYEIRPYKRIGVLLSKDNRKLYVGGIPLNKSEDDVYREISRLTEGVTKVCVLPNSYDHTKNRGFAFVEYESHRHVSIARRVLLSGNVKLFNRKVTVDWADPEPEIDEESLKELYPVFFWRGHFCRWLRGAQWAHDRRTTIKARCSNSLTCCVCVGHYLGAKLIFSPTRIYGKLEQPSLELSRLYWNPKLVWCESLKSGEASGYRRLRLDHRVMF